LPGAGAVAGPKKNSPSIRLLECCRIRPEVPEIGLVPGTGSLAPDSASVTASARLASDPAAGLPPRRRGRANPVRSVSAADEPRHGPTPSRPHSGAAAPNFSLLRLGIASVAVLAVLAGLPRPVYSLQPAGYKYARRRPTRGGNFNYHLHRRQIPGTIDCDVRRSRHRRIVTKHPVTCYIRTRLPALVSRAPVTVFQPLFSSRPT